MTQAPTPGSSSDHLELFTGEKYLVRRKLINLLSTKFHIYDESGELVMFSKMKAFKLKEDIRLYAGEEMETELLSIKARQMIDFSASYDVVDAVLNEKVGALRRRGMKSLLRDEWELLDANDQPIGTLREDSTFRALLRRFIEAAAFLMPQAYHVEVGGSPACLLKQRFNPIIFKLDVDFTPDQGIRLDRRLGLAAAVLMAAIEGKQN